MRQGSGCLENYSSKRELFDMEKTGAVLVAAGLSSRMGAFKPMLPFGSSTVALHMISLLKKEGIEPIVVVTGYRADDLEYHLRDAGVRFSRNERYRETQMFDSVRIGIRAIYEECERFMILPIDTPAIMPETIRKLLKLNAPLSRTICRGKPGHPILISSKTAKRLCTYEGPGGLRGAMEHDGIPITNLEVDDEGIYRDMDTREEYMELLRWNNERLRNCKEIQETD